MLRGSLWVRSVGNVLLNNVVGDWYTHDVASCSGQLRVELRLASRLGGVLLHLESDWKNSGGVLGVGLSCGCSHLVVSLLSSSLSAVFA